MNIPYSEREKGQFYYCLSANDIQHEYIFQCDVLNGDNFPSIHKREGQHWETISRDSNFKTDWKMNADKEMRLATPEEILLIQQRDDAGYLIPVSNYEIY